MKTKDMSDREVMERFSTLTSNLKEGRKKALLDSLRSVLKSRRVEIDALRKKVNLLNRKVYPDIGGWKFIVQEVESLNNKLTISPSEAEVRLKLSSSSSEKVHEELTAISKKILQNFSLPVTGRGKFKWHNGEYQICLEGSGDKQYFYSDPEALEVRMKFSKE